jgi:hypothetical protein
MNVKALLLWGRINVQNEGHFTPYLERSYVLLVIGSCASHHLGRLERLLEDHVGVAVAGS